MKKVISNISIPIIFVLFFTIGCTPKMVTVPIEVYIPVKCKVEKLERPDLNKKAKTSDKVKELLIYIEELERDLKFCREGETT